MPSYGGQSWPQPAFSRLPRMITSSESRLKGGCGQDWPPYMSSLPAFLRLFDLRPRVAQRHRPIEYRTLRRGVLVYAEVAQALELIPAQHRRALQRWLHFRVLDGLKRLRVQVCREVPPFL